MWSDCTWANRVSRSLLAVLLLCSSAAVGQTLERLVPAKPTRGEMSKAATTNRVVVKFREGSGIRLRGGDLVAAPGTDLTELRNTLLGAGITPGQMRRLHARPERELDDERAAAKRRSGRDLADLNLYYVVKLAPGANAAGVAERLNRSPTIEFAEPELKPSPLPVDLSPTTSNLSRSQGYRSPPPGGVGALDPASVPGSDGTGISVVDIEYDWVLNHEDLELPASANIDSATLSDPFHPRRVVTAQQFWARLGAGGTPMASPASTGRPHDGRPVEHERIRLQRGAGDRPGDRNAGGRGRHFDRAAGAGLRRELQVGPGRLRSGRVLAVQLRRARDRHGQGIVVIETAGNGTVNLDGPSCGGLFNRSTRDSGAIIVGAGDSAARSRLWYSSHGSRVDVQGWGNSITTTGYGDAFNHPGDIRQRYTHVFGGTSGAAPIVTGSVLALQGALKARGLALATPAEMREALVVTGTAQTGTEHIGPLPNIKAALDRLLERRGALPGWKPWVSRGGNLASFPECELAGSGIGCWARSVAGTLLWNRSADGNTWSGWTDLGGIPTGAPDCLVRGSRIDCFVTTSLKKLAQKTYNGTAWGAWVDLGGAVVARPSCVPAASGLALDCFATGTNNALWRRQFDGTAWKAWQSVGGSTTLRPSCVRRGTGIDCFVVDASKNLKTRRLSGGTWGAWTQLATGVATAPQCLVASGKMDCFAQSGGRQLLKGYHNGTSWGTWTNLGGDVSGEPHCNRSSTGFDCYWPTSTSRLVRRQRSGTTWLAQEDLGGTVQQRPVCLPGSDGTRIDCMVRGTDNTLRQRSYY
jgi:hypothetical protein